MKKLFSKNAPFPKKAMIVGTALAVVVGLSYFGSGNYLNQSIMDMLMGGTTSCCYSDDSPASGCTCGTSGGCGGYDECPDYDNSKCKCARYCKRKNKSFCSVSTCKCSNSS